MAYKSSLISNNVSMFVLCMTINICSKANLSQQTAEHLHFSTAHNAFHSTPQTNVL